MIDRARIFITNVFVTIRLLSMTEINSRLIEELWINMDRSDDKPIFGCIQGLSAIAPGQKEGAECQCMVTPAHHFAPPELRGAALTLTQSMVNRAQDL